MSRELAAIHEAGHATVAIALGLTVERVELLDGDQPRGCTSIGPADTTDPSKEWALIVVLVAGLVAEMMIAPEEGLEPKRDASRSDMEGAMGLLLAQGLSFDDAKERLGDAAAEAYSILERWSNLHIDIRCGLEARGTVDAEHLNTLVSWDAPREDRFSQN